MKNTAFTDILFNWEKMSTNKKVQRMQDFENMVARLQGRKPRKISIRSDKKIFDLIGKDRLPEAYYNRSDSENLYIFNLSSSPIDILKNIIHEGFHAYVHDFVMGKIQSLRLYSKMNSEQFYIEEENLPAIQNEFVSKNLMPLFDSYYIEEKINYSEDSTYLVKFIMDSITSIDDALKLQEAFLLSLAYHADNTIRGKIFERKNNVKYDEVVVEALNKQSDEKIVVNKTGKITTEIEPELYAFVMKACDKYKEFSNLVHGRSVLITEQARKTMADQTLNEMMAMYRSYVISMLKAKKKN